MKKDLDIILSLTAIAGVVILAILWCCRSMSLTAISLDTFIGVMATISRMSVALIARVVFTDIWPLGLSG